MKTLKPVIWSIAALGMIILLAQPAVEFYRWLAWHVFTKDFQAVCTEYSELTGDGVDHYLVVEGPYTDEFWRQLRIAYATFPKKLKPEWAHWQRDGTLRVPVGFDFKPAEEDGLDVMPHDRRRRERSHVISAWAVYAMLEDRKAAGLDLQPYRKYAFTDPKRSYPPTIRANTCGFMSKLITVGGALATP